jgi:C-terminal processing protease CtpA/Prc
MKTTFAKYLSVAVLLAFALLVGACTPQPIPEPDPSDPEDVQVNKWTYQILSYYYLWNEEVKAIKPAYETDYQSFLTNILSAVKVNTLDGKIYSGSRSYYSYISSAPVTRAGSFTFAPTYGMSIRAYGFNIQTQTGVVLRYFARIQYVTPNSPAANAGLKRGDWIGRIDGKQILAGNFSDINKLLPTNSSSVKVLKCSFTANSTGDGVIFKEEAENKAVTLTRTTVEENPIHTHKVLTTNGGTKVGYLLFNQFKRGYDESDLENSDEYEQQLRSVFAEFKRAGVEELVLDLRYNGGGYVSTAQLLSSMIAPQSKLGSKWLECRPNASRKSNWYNLLTAAEVADCNLSLPRLYVIASGSSASASELMINNLRGLDVEVIHIGSKTEGKVVGMEVIDHLFNSTDKAIFGNYQYTLHPVSFRSYDAKGTSNYENGLIPNHFYDEYMDEQSLRWIEWGELGDASEPMLRIALDKIDGVTTTLSATRLSKIDVGAVACPNELQHNSLRGTIVAPTDNFYNE